MYQRKGWPHQTFASQVIEALREVGTLKGYIEEVDVGNSKIKQDFSSNKVLGDRRGLGFVKNISTTSDVEQKLC